MAEDNILIRIKGEADMSDAQVQLQDMTAKSKALKDQMQQLISIEEKYKQEQQARIAAGKGESELIDKVLQKKRQQRMELQQEINANERNIDALKKSTSAYAATQGAGRRLAMQVRQIREELSRLEMAGDTSSQTFIDLAVKAAQLQDQMGDTQQQISILASDTKNLDAAMSVGQGLAGAFNTATSAAALLGGESEALQQAFLKVQAAMAVLNGVQQVANSLNKDSAGNVVLRTALQKLFNKEKAQETTLTAAAATAATADAGAKAAETAATTAATTATKGFTAALLANPVTAIIAAVATLTAGIVALTKHLQRAAEEQRNLNGQLQTGTTLMERMASDSERNMKFAEAEGQSQMEILRQRRDNLQKIADMAQNTYDRMLKSAGTNWKKLSDEEKAALEEAKKARDEAYANAQKAWDDVTALDIKQRREKKERDKKDAAEAAKQRKAERDQRNKEIEDAGKQAQELWIRNNEEGMQRDLDLIDLEYDQRIAAIKGNSPQELALIAELTVEREKKKKEIEDRYRMQDIQDEYEFSKIRIQNEYDTSDKQYDARLQYLMAMNDLETEYIMNTEKNAKLREEKLLAAETKLREDIANIDKEIAKETQDAIAAETQALLSNIQQLIGQVNELLGAFFDWASDRVQQQLDDLDNMYTTDADEARENADKKYLTEKEYHDKQVALKRKQAQIDKAQGAFNIGISTAQAIMTTLAQLGGTPIGYAMMALVAATGAVQLAAVLSKPLPQYAKGRKGGEGEMALVGEKGPEIMYVPKGASIIPNSKIDTPDAWSQYGIPQPEIESALMTMALTQASIDYDRLGKTIADNMPKAKMVSVSIDRNGVGIYEGRTAHKIHNQKYTGQWN